MTDPSTDQQGTPKGRAYYNEIDPFAAAWLRELIKAGLIADGEVDERSIELVRPGDLAGFVQCHFFAGIGGWSYALRLAGWPDDRAVWTGSCPCQPWSVAGFRAGADDPRHLWPAWKRLVAECRPATVFGEQVASEDGGYWCDLVCSDLEAMGYAFGAGVLPATCVGAPEGRHRLWFVADAAGARQGAVGEEGQDGARVAFRMGDSDRAGLPQRVSYRSSQPETAGAFERQTAECTSDVAPSRMADADVLIASYEQLQRSWRLVQLESDPLTGFWSGADWLRCDDSKVRPVEPDTFPLAYGLPARVGRLRGYGNAIVPQAAAAFIEAYTDVRRGVERGI